MSSNHFNLSIIIAETIADSIVEILLSRNIRAFVELNPRSRRSGLRKVNCFCTPHTFYIAIRDARLAAKS